MLKKFFCVLCLLGFSFGSITAADPLEKFKQTIKQETEARLKELCKDLAPMMNSNISHEGATLKLLGFDVGLKASAKTVSDKNVIVKSADVPLNLLPIAALQLEIGLPAKLNLIGRYAPPYENLSLIGAGIKYNLFKSAIPGLPDISLLGFYSQLTHPDYFRATSGSVNLAVSFDIPVVKPFVGVGYDFIELKVNENVTQELSLGTLKSTADDLRVEGGVNFSFIPFTYFYLGAGLANETLLYNLAVGVKFGGI